MTRKRSSFRPRRAALPPSSWAPEHDTSAAIRRILLALVLLGTAGLALELVLLEHTESLSQWLPFAVLAAGFGASVWVAGRPTPRAIHSFRLAMGLFVAVGVLGVYLHLRGNLLFELEIDPSVRGLALISASLRGATPTVAPGALVQLGLLGLAYTYRHPVLTPSLQPEEKS